MGMQSAVAVALGIWGAEQGWLGHGPPVAYFAAAALAFAVALCCPRPLRPGAWAAALLALGAGRARHVVAPQALPATLHDGRARPWIVRIEGPCMRSAPEGGRATVSAPARVVAYAQSAAATDPWQPAAGRVRLWLLDDADIGAGDVLRLPLQTLPLPAARAPWEDGAAVRARWQQLSGRVLAQGAPVRLLAGTGVLAGCDRLRLRAGRALDHCLPARASPLAKAVALGDASSVPGPQRDRFGDAGVAHLLAVSGLHVSIVGRLAESLARAALQAGLWRGSAWPARASAGPALASVWAYALLVGSGVSVLRAAWMASAALLARALGFGGRSGLQALALSALCLLLRDPLALYAVSAQLSFVSVAGLLLLTWPLPHARTRTWRAARALVAGLVEGSVASLVTWPICAAAFGRVSLVAPLCNLLAIPLATLLATPASLLLVACVSVPWLSPLTKPVAAVAGASLCWLDALAQAAASPSFAAAQSPPWPPLRIAAWAAALLAFALWRGARREAPLLRRCRSGHLASLLAVAAALGCAERLHARWSAAPSTLRVWQLDVGQGDATLLGLPDGQWALIDGGGATHPGARDPGRFVVVPALRALGVRRLAWVLLTHPHPDHMMGLSSVFAQVPVARFVYNADAEQSAHVARLAAQVRAAGGQAQRAASQYTFGGAQFDVLQAPIAHDAPAGPLRKRTVNDRSLVVRITFGATSMLVTGDIEAAAEQWLAPRLAPVDLLQVSHHGSNTSSTEALLAAVRPKVAWISCGERNRYAFPHPQVCARLQAVTNHIYSTARRGTLMATSDGRAFVYACGAGGACTP